MLKSHDVYAIDLAMSCTLWWACGYRLQISYIVTPPSRADARQLDAPLGVG